MNIHTEPPSDEKNHCTCISRHTKHSFVTFVFYLSDFLLSHACMFTHGWRAPIISAFVSILSYPLPYLNYYFHLYLSFLLPFFSQSLCHFTSSSLPYFYTFFFCHGQSYLPSPAPPSIPPPTSTRWMASCRDASGFTCHCSGLPVNTCPPSSSPCQGARRDAGASPLPALFIQRLALYAQKDRRLSLPSKQ